MALFLYFYKIMKQMEFRFKRFSVTQGQCALKVSTDSVLLGAWCNAGGVHRILDVGTGCGIIALMMAQKNPSAKIDAVEIDALSSEEAASNFFHSEWAMRLNAYHSDFLSYSPGCSYELIISNPPFFDKGHAAPDKRRATARHSASLPFESLIARSASLLSPRMGRLALIAPSEVKSEIEFFAGENNLWLNRRAGIRTVPTKPIRRYLWEFANYPTSFEESEITLQDKDGNKTAEYLELTQNFYL